MSGTKHFGNVNSKIEAFLSVMEVGEKLKGFEVEIRVRNLGYSIKEGNGAQFMNHNMVYKTVTRERDSGKTFYSKI